MVWELTPQGERTPRDDERRNAQPKSERKQEERSRHGENGQHEGKIRPRAWRHRHRH